MGNYKEDVTLLDVCPFSLGIAVREDEFYKENGRSMSYIIKKETSLPFKITKENFHPAHENATSVLIEIYEGENKFVKDNYLLGKFQLLNLPKKKNMILILKLLLT